MSLAVNTFSIIIKPEAGNWDPSVKLIVVAVSVIAPFNVVDICSVDIATPPTGDLTSLNLAKSFTCKSPFGKLIFNVVLDAVTKGLLGKISDSYTVVPEYKGKYKIPEVEFSYFDPNQEKYITITSEPLIIDVVQGKSLPNQNQTDIPSKQTTVTATNNFRYIQHKTSFESMKKQDFFKSNLFYMLLLLPFLAIPIGIFIGKKKAERDSDVTGNRLRKADKLARKYLSQAKKELGKKETFYLALEKALHNFLKARLNIETTDISKERITEILQQRNVDETTINEFVEVLNDCDFARYTPTTNVMMQKEFDKAKKVITKIDKQV